MGLDSLIKFAEGEAYCPCCTGVYKCDPECTVREDAERLGGESWIRYERMLAARAALEV